MTNTQTNATRHKSTGALAHFGKVALIVAILAVVAELVILFGARLGFWAPIEGFGFYRKYFNPIAFVAAGAGLVSLIIHIVRKERGAILQSGIAFLAGMALLVPLMGATLDPPVRAAPIHDITTNTQNPPKFLVLDDTRSDATNSLEYSGQETADIQQSAYPDIAPILTEMSAEDAFEHALNIAKDMGWQIVSPTSGNLRFEATARTQLFYFADDIVLVVTPQLDGSRVDLRSVSRVGRSDQGVNAERIRAFVAAFTG